MKKLIIAAVVVAVLLVAGVVVFLNKTPEAMYKTGRVERGTVISAVAATGTVNAVTTVQVGTQVSGTIQRLYVDFNSHVKKGQAIAQIDPALFNAQQEQTRGNFLNAEATVQKAKITVADAKRTLERNRRLLADGIISQGDYDAAETAYEGAQASLQAATGTVMQTRGAYAQAQTNLKYSTIKSPVDGIIVSRAVDVGQTVAASFQTPTLFTIAQDLTKMQIDTSVDEADISKVRLGQPVTFTVDAYPEQKFSGEVRQIRNAPIVTQNVVTYNVVIGVDNHELKLKPGMTANVTIEVTKKEDVLTVPTAALRFKPKEGEAEKKKPNAIGPGKVAKPGSTGKGPEQKVYILSKENRPVAVPVKTGITSDSRLELVSGNLKENDEVIVEQVPAKKKAAGTGSPMGPRF